MRNIYSVKYYSREGFVEHKIEIGDEDLEEIIREYLERHAGSILHTRRCVASATNLHDALSVRRNRNFTMRCRKKLYDALSVHSWQ